MLYLVDRHSAGIQHGEKIRENGAIPRPLSTIHSK
jgi:hypothetical protein